MIDFGPGIILVCDFYCPSDNTLFLLFFSGVTRVSGTGVYAFIFLNIIFGNVSLLEVKCWLLMG